MYMRIKYNLKKKTSKNIYVVVVVTFRHQAEGIAPIEALVLILLFSAIGAITENGPCTHYSLVEVQHQTVPHECQNTSFESQRLGKVYLFRQIVGNFGSSKVKVLSEFLGPVLEF